MLLKALCKTRYFAPGLLTKKLAMPPACRKRRHRTAEKTLLLAMTSNRPQAVRSHRTIRKTLLLAMKITAFILFAALHVCAKGIGQSITLSMKDATLDKVFKEIQKQSGYAFVYFNDDLANTNKIDIAVKAASLEEVLELCIKDQPLSFSITDKIIVIKKALPAAPVDHTPSPPPGEITGQVRKKSGEPLGNASIIVKRTGKGTMADVNGRFTLTKLQPGDELLVSYTGFTTKTVRLDENTDIFVVLQEADNILDQAVVQAYGRTSQRYATGNIGKVTAAEIERQPVMNPLLALQGKIAGLDVVRTSGYASAPIKVELRGRGALDNSFTSDPFYVIDGVPLTVLEIGGFSTYQQGSTGFIQNSANFKGPAQGLSPLFSLNPSDIESIEVLKDADATAIYGSRGANGVILITTKKGKTGKTQFDLNVQQGITRVTRFWELMNTQQYLKVRREAFANDAPLGITMDHDNAYDLLDWDTTRYTDWQKVLYGGTGKALNVQAGLSGGNAQTTFRFGAGYNRTTDILTVSGADQRGSFSINVNHYSLNRRFNASFTAGYSISRSNMIALPGNFYMPPNAPPIYDSAGKFNYAGWGGASNSSQGRQAYPFAAALGNPYTSTTNFLNSNLVLNYELIKGLKLTTSFGYNNAQANQQQFQTIASQDPEAQPTASSYFGNNSNKNWIIEPQATYETLIWRGKLSALAGGSVQQTNTSGLFTGGSGYTSDNLLNFLSGAPSVASSNTSGEYRYAALFGRLTYNLENKYILNLNARRDGSSRFGEGKQFGNFGSVGAAWIFSQENWFSRHLSFISFGKLRASYGTTGSDGVGDYKFLTRWSSNGIRPYNGGTSIRPTQHANPDFQWQVNKKREAALDLGFLHDRIVLNTSWYRNRCGNQLVSIPIATLTGFSGVVANWPALIQNEGWEFTLSARIIQTKNFGWSVNFNTAINHNKLLAYPGINQSPYKYLLKVGKPLNSTYLLHYTGVDTQTGLYTFEDKNHDGQIIYFPSDSLDDSYYANLTPKFQGGLGMNFNYKQLSVSLFFVFKKQTGPNGLVYGQSPGSMANQPVYLYGREWQKPGDKATVARFSTQRDITDDYFKAYSDGGYTDASYIRLSNLSVSYSLPEAYINKAGLKGCSVFFNTNNLFVITKYKGLDPETQNFGGMPPVKTIVLGLSFNF